GFNDNPRNNWSQIAGQLTSILTPSRVMQEAFVRAGVKTPVHVVPVPVDSACFQIPDWSPDRKVVIDCPAYEFPQQEVAARPPVPGPWAKRSISRLQSIPKFCYKKWIEGLFTDEFN